MLLPVSGTNSENHYSQIFAFPFVKILSAQEAVINLHRREKVTDFMITMESCLVLERKPICPAIIFIQ